MIYIKGAKRQEEKVLQGKEGKDSQGLETSCRVTWTDQVKPH